jgi:mannosyltransferase
MVNTEWHRSERVLLAAALISAAVFLAVGIKRPVFVDEAYSVLIASRGFSAIVEGCTHDNNLPAYYFLLSVWIRIFGDSEVALRSLSGLFYLGGCGAAFALGRRLTGDRRAGWYSAVLYEASALAIGNAQNIRMYEMTGMLSGLSTLAFLRLFRDGENSGKLWAWWIAVNAIGMFTHPWFVFPLAGQAVALLIHRRRQVFRFAGGLAAAVTPFAMLWGRNFIAQAHNGATDWMPRFRIGHVPAAPLEFYGVPAAFGIYGLLIGGIYLARRHGKKLPAATWWMVAVFATSAAAPLMVSTIRPIYLPGRYMLIALPPLAVALGTLLPAVLPRPMVVATLLLVLGIEVTQQVRDRDLMMAAASIGQRVEAPIVATPRSDRATVEFLLEHARPGDAIIFTSLSRTSAEYYLRRAGGEGRFVRVSFPEEVAQHLGWNDPMVGTRGAALNAEAATLAVRLSELARRGARVWLYDGYTPDLNRILRGRLDAALEERHAYPVAGTYQTRIVEYGAR